MSDAQASQVELLEDAAAMAGDTTHDQGATQASPPNPAPVPATDKRVKKQKEVLTIEIIKIADYMQCRKILHTDDGWL